MRDLQIPIPFIPNSLSEGGMADQQIKAGSKEAFGEELMKFRLVAPEPR
jgi:hypothetical protein